MKFNINTSLSLLDICKTNTAKTYSQMQDNLSAIIDSSEDNIDLIQLRYETDVYLYEFFKHLPEQAKDTNIDLTGVKNVIDQMMIISNAKEKIKGIRKVELLRRKLDVLAEFVYTSID